jgi:hypothetical protein
MLICLKTIQQTLELIPIGFETYPEYSDFCHNCRIYIHIIIL